jgi:ADP-heptose:LPS heptosyltransferase
LRRLLIRPGALGDFIVSLPALQALRAGYTEVWVPGPHVPLVRFADRVRAIAATGLDLAGIEGVEPPRSLWRALAGFDSIVSWYGANRPELREAVHNYPFKFFSALPDSGHAVDFYLTQAAELLGSAVVPAYHPQIVCDAPPARDNFAVIHPFSGSATKNWPLENYRRLARRLERRMPVKWCAGPEEHLDDAVRFDDLYDLACWLASASLYIGNDSGPTHLAAAVGTPVVAIFQATDPAIWAPRSHAPVKVIDHPLSVDAVLAAIATL